MPQIFNTDQGSQFTSLEIAATLKDAGVAISMDGMVRRGMPNLTPRPSLYRLNRNTKTC